MTNVPRFAYHRPRSLEEALELLARLGDDARVVAGGTDLIPKLRAGGITAAHLVSLSDVAGLERLEVDDKGDLIIGAGTRIVDVAQHPRVVERYPALAHACSVMATCQIRNMGTVAGNLANGSPCADTSAPLLVYDATLSIVGPGGAREARLDSFYRGPKQVELAHDEVIRHIRVPAPPDGARSTYLRLSARSQVDMAAAGVAGLAVVGPDGKISDLRLALSAVAPTPIRCRDAEALARDEEPAPERLAAIAAACADAAQPIDDVRATADWRRLVVGVLAGRVLDSCLGRKREVAP